MICLVEGGGPTADAATRLKRSSWCRKRSSKYRDRATAPEESPIDAPYPGGCRAQKGAPAGGRTGSGAEFEGPDCQIAVIQDRDRCAVRLRSGALSLLWTSREAKCRRREKKTAEEVSGRPPPVKRWDSMGRGGSVPC
ncbi:hypothetical protein NDU88_002637 [Pleurodeles waltl]|uniref:Uncharacterized protein n=1 Tax=Pleurodeles waltl TaxID=8319 RepID=A0AAV7P792_PLEWA|nr:hypothetical protein NDU88_002637 [Pleurodeles waltl]